MVAPSVHAGMSGESAARQKSEHSVKLPYLYKEGSKILKAYSEKKGTLKSLVYATRSPRQYRRLLALVSRAVQQLPAVDASLAAAGLPAAEPGLDFSTARLLAAELLFGSGRLASRARPVLTVLGYADRLRASAASRPPPDPATAAAPPPSLPRYARINTLLGTVDDVIQQLTGEGWRRVEYATDVGYEEFLTHVKSLSSGQFLLDLHVPCLLVFPPGTELHQHALYRSGRLILQDKASCLPAMVLAPAPGEHVIDACSAPGMKTSHLAALLQNTGSVLAVERDMGRFETLKVMLHRAGVANTRPIRADFMRLRPADHPRVTCILLDPSCSGTGMVGRAPQPDSVSADRLRRLANLQAMLLRHALSFPAVRRVVYSTCSVSEEENEQVVAATLADQPGWRLADAAPATWRSRGRSWLADGERCIRASVEHDLCHGFFVCAFVRRRRRRADSAGRSAGRVGARDPPPAQRRKVNAIVGRPGATKRGLCGAEAADGAKVGVGGFGNPVREVGGSERGAAAKRSPGEVSGEAAAAPVAKRPKRGKRRQLSSRWEDNADRREDRTDVTPSVEARAAVEVVGSRAGGSEEKPKLKAGESKRKPELPAGSGKVKPKPFSSSSRGDNVASLTAVKCKLDRPETSGKRPKAHTQSKTAPDKKVKRLSKRRREILKLKHAASHVAT